MNRCRIVMFVGFCISFLINPSARPIHILRKSRLIDLEGLVVVGINSLAWKYYANYSLVVWSRILFSTFFVVVFPEELPTFLFVCSWFLLIFVVHYFGL